MNAIRELLGCSWGRKVRTADDPDECPSQAVRIVVVNDGPLLIDLKVCARHAARLIEETNPHSGQPS